jgi:hypothetical protein
MSEKPIDWMPSEVTYQVGDRVKCLDGVERPVAAVSTYMTSPWGDRDALGRPWPDVQVQPRKPRRRKR